MSEPQRTFCLFLRDPRDGGPSVGVSIDNTQVGSNSPGPQPQVTNKWLQCCEIPRSHLPSFSSSPSRWLAFVAYCILGAKGRLSLSPDRADNSCPLNGLFDALDSAVAQDNGSKLHFYFHVDDEEQDRIFPLDPDLANPRSVTHSSANHFSDFRANVMQLDNNVDVVTGLTAYNQVAHLIAHSKGDHYINVLTKQRARIEEDVVENIDDPRNGLTTNVLLHFSMDAVEIAFLPLPNVFMLVSDAPSAIHNNPLVALPSGGKSYLINNFQEVDGVPVHVLYRPFVGHNTVLCQVREPSKRPPDVIFEALYGSAVIKAYGNRSNMKNLSRKSTKALYPRGLARANAEYVERQAAAKVKAEEQAAQRKAAQDQDQDQDFDALDIILAFSTLYAEKARRKAKAQGIVAEDPSRAKVRNWLQEQQLQIKDAQSSKKRATDDISILRLNASEKTRREFRKSV